MKKMFGLVLFWTAVGMLLMLFIDNALCGTIIGAIGVIVGYHLYSNAG